MPNFHTARLDLAHGERYLRDHSPFQAPVQLPNLTYLIVTISVPSSFHLPRFLALLHAPSLQTLVIDWYLDSSPTDSYDLRTALKSFLSRCQQALASIVLRNHSSSNFDAADISPILVEADVDPRLLEYQWLGQPMWTSHSPVMWGSSGSPSSDLWDVHTLDMSPVPS
ncbi:hypothetical protein VNI00_017547 [Paramarasmius palmivorus]|uniref:Uncharacterized protein n=1 Tax=Paramarasmius palmivorus TaxID=297713 RepID=A0AAW0B5M9_9AGAR